jgi:hypothetical protein
MSIVIAGLALVAGVLSVRTEPVKVYTLELKGTFGREVALAPTKEAMEEAARLKADVVLVKLDADFTPEGSESTVLIADTSRQREVARELAGALVPDDWQGTPRIVTWVKRAEGGAAVLVYAMPELVYTPNAVHDPVVEFASLGDGGHARSLVLGRMQAIALRGGHPVELLTAMVRKDYVLSAHINGSDMEFHEDLSGELVLSNADDLLRLDAATAQKLGLSKGTAATEGDVWKAVGISDVRHVGNNRDEMERWRRGVFDAEREVADLVTRINELRVAAPGGYDERATARTERTQMARDILSRLEKFGSALDAARIGKDPEQLRGWCKDAIEKLAKEQSLDRRQ